MPQEASTSTRPYHLDLLYFSDDIVTIYYRRAISDTGRIYAISTRLETGDRLLKEIPLESNRKLFVRNTASWIYYGTHSAMGTDGHHEWEIRGVSLDDGKASADMPRLTLERFFGNDIRSTVAFEVRNDWFYAVSNQTSFEVEEIDWTSFYHCIRFPLNYPKRKDMKVDTRIYRRQHQEGPIHDSWTELTIQFDDATGQAKIVESRCEWTGSSSRRRRAFYVTDFNSDPTHNSDKSSEQAIELAEDDDSTGLIDRPNPSVHFEITPECSTARTFNLACTKLKAYNLSSNSFLDLVEDKNCCNRSDTNPCLRIRVGSRRVAPLNWRDHGYEYTLSTVPGEYFKTRDTPVYHRSPIKMWPPPALTCSCSERLHDILKPPLPNGAAYSREVTGSLDQYGFVYMLRPENAAGVIIMVSFDRASSASPSKETASIVHASQSEGIFDPSYWQWEAGVCKKGICY